MAGEVMVSVTINLEFSMPIPGMRNKSENGIVEYVFNTSWSDDICRIAQTGTYGIVGVDIYDTEGNQIYGN